MWRWLPSETCGRQTLLCLLVVMTVLAAQPVEALMMRSVKGPLRTRPLVMNCESKGVTGAAAVPALEPIDIPTARFPSYVWTWRGDRIRYQAMGHQGPALLLVHGFGGNCEHWRRNIEELAQFSRVYTIDLLGYGYSDKPKESPPAKGPFIPTLYNFQTWGDQLGDFVEEVIKSPCYCVCNSIGGVVGLQLAVTRPAAVKGVVLINISLRMLHIKKQAWWAKPFVPMIQAALRETPMGKQFFSQIATPQGVRSVLEQAYCGPEQVTDELVEAILRPGLLDGAVDVFLSFISYSGGPLPEELLPITTQPVLILWGESDPWEPIELGHLYGQFPCVQDFVPLKGAGHCPQDSHPQLVNPLVKSFVEGVEGSGADQEA